MTYSSSNEIKRLNRSLRNTGCGTAEVSICPGLTLCCSFSLRRLVNYSSSVSSLNSVAHFYFLSFSLSLWSERTRARED